ncbi:MAG TPA: DNA cytosine methyltransferase [Oscillatoriaceae cyanobacterium]
MDLPKFFAVDFFCGAGGTTRGLIDAGGFVIAGVDKDRRCSDTYTKNNPNQHLTNAEPAFLNRDIFPKSPAYAQGEQDTLLAELTHLIGQLRRAHPKVPLLFAICAPCQPFTTLARKELSEARKSGRERDSNLLSEAAKFVAHFKPEMVLSENVQGIGDSRYGGVWDAFEAKLQSLGYATGTEVVCTSKFGVPQHRRRSILLAVKRPEGSREATLVVPTSDPATPTKTVRQALEAAALPPIKAGEHWKDDPNHRARSLSPTNLKRLALAEPGASNAYMEKGEAVALMLDCHKRVNQRVGTRCFTDVYTRMHPDRPSPTITTKCHSISNGRFGYFDKAQNRGISLREAAILQSFPPEYVFYPTNQVDPVARMIGNAVPPRLAEFFSRHLIGLLEPPAS